MIGAYKGKYNFWITPHEIRMLGSEPVKGILQKEEYSIIGCTIKVNHQARSQLEAKLENFDGRMILTMAPSYLEQLREYGQTTVLTPYMEMIKIQDIRLQKDKVKRLQEE